MKITCARNRADILKDKEAYAKRKQLRREQREAQAARYKEDYRSVVGPVKAQVEDAISPFNDLNLEVDIWEPLDSNPGLMVVVYSNRNNVHSKDKALSWEWSAKIDMNTGEVIKDSGSWSGLNAVTAENIRSLRQSVDCLETLNSMDWQHILNVKLPDLNDYTLPQEKDPDADRDFDQELVEADIEDAIGSGALIAGHGYQYYRPSARVYYQVLKESESNYWVSEIYPSEADDPSQYPEPYRITKKKFFGLIDKPVELVEVE